MGFNLSAFGAGFATAAVKDIQEEQKLAELRGAEAVKIMQANYKTVNEENKKREAELVGNIDLLKAYDPTATDSQLYAISTNKPVMDAITGYIKNDQFDPASFKLSNFAKVTENNVTATALERVKMLSTLPVIAKAAVTEQLAPSGNILKDLLSTSSAKAKEKAMLEYAQASGIPLERLQAAQGFVRPKVDVAAEIDMSKLRPEKKFSDVEAQAKLDSFKARQANDPAALAAATAKLANVVAVNTEAALTGKTEAQIQSNMITNIQRLAKEGKAQEAATEQALLVQRQRLEKLPPKEGKTDADKITQSNKIQIASRAVLSAVQDSLPPGSFITVTDRDGNVTTELKDLTQSSRYDAGIAAGRQQMINRFTINGKPKGEAEQNALASIGVQFDDKGIAFVPKVERPATERRNPAAAPSGAGRLGSAPSGRNVAPAAPVAPRSTAAPAGLLVWDEQTQSFK
jgi:hypothetical protein